MRSLVYLVVILVVSLPANIFAQESNDSDNLTVTIDFPLFSSGQPHFSDKLMVIDSDSLFDANTKIESLIARVMLPKVSVYSKDFRAHFDWGMFRSRNDKLMIKNIESSLEHSLWWALVGMDGYGEEERFPGLIEQDNFAINFYRFSYGGNLFLGLKFGDYRKYFFTAKFKKGYAWLQAKERYQSNIVPSLAPIEWYDAKFNVSSVTVEGRISLPRIAPSLSIEGSRYNLATNDINTLFYEKGGDFNRAILVSAFEITPLLQHDFVRLFVSYRKTMIGRSGSLLMGEPPEFQIFLRLAFR